jgi:hypothetical protein
MAKNGNGTTPLRDWAMQSYGVENGRQVSAIESRGNMGNHAQGKGRQVPSFTRGSNAGYSKGGPDGGRVKLGGSKVW